MCGFTLNTKVGNDVSENKTNCQILFIQTQQMNEKTASVLSLPTNCLAEGRRSKLRKKNLAEELQ